MKRLSKKKCDILIQECIDLVKKQDPDFFILKKLKGAMGICHWEWIELDPRKNFLPTAIHECLHYLYEDWPETMILYAESRIMNQVEYVKLMEFISVLSSKLYKKEKNKSSISENKNKK
jgi:hypothetical protein